MQLETLIRRRFMTANEGRPPIVHIEFITETDGGGIALGFAAYHRRAAMGGNMFIPATMRPALEQEKRNQALDSKFKL